MQVWASSQEGDPGTWSQVGELPSGASSLSIDTGVSPAALYAGLETGGVVRSADGGTTWQARNSGLTSVPTVADIDIDPQAPIGSSPPRQATPAKAGTAAGARRMLD